MKIYRNLRIRSFKGGLEVKALFDTGASFTVIRRGVAEKDRLHPSNGCKGGYVSGW